MSAPVVLVFGGCGVLRRRDVRRDPRRVLPPPLRVEAARLRRRGLRPALVVHMEPERAEHAAYAGRPLVLDGDPRAAREGHGEIAVQPEVVQPVVARGLPPSRVTAGGAASSARCRRNRPAAPPRSASPRRPSASAAPPSATPAAPRRWSWRRSAGCSPAPSMSATTWVSPGAIVTQSLFPPERSHVEQRAERAEVSVYSEWSGSCVIVCRPPYTWLSFGPNAMWFASSRRQLAPVLIGWRGCARSAMISSVAGQSRMPDTASSAWRFW